jgi:hypothetical protein
MKTPVLLRKSASRSIDAVGGYRYHCHSHLGMLLPALSRAKAKAIAINCTNNTKQMGLAHFMYDVDHR